MVDSAGWADFNSTFLSLLSLPFPLLRNCLSVCVPVLASVLHFLDIGWAHMEGIWKGSDEWTISFTLISTDNSKPAAWFACSAANLAAYNFQYIVFYPSNRYPISLIRTNPHFYHLWLFHSHLLTNDSNLLVLSTITKPVQTDWISLRMYAWEWMDRMERMDIRKASFAGGKFVFGILWYTRYLICYCYHSYIALSRNCHDFSVILLAFFSLWRAVVRQPLKDLCSTDPCLALWDTARRLRFVYQLGLACWLALSTLSDSHLLTIFLLLCV